MKAVCCCFQAEWHWVKCEPVEPTTVAARLMETHVPAAGCEVVVSTEPAGALRRQLAVCQPIGTNPWDAPAVRVLSEQVEAWRAGAEKVRAWTGSPEKVPSWREVSAGKVDVWRTEAEQVEAWRSELKHVEQWDGGAECEVLPKRGVYERTSSEEEVHSDDADDSRLVIAEPKPQRRMCR